jgi:hypothetical protein
MVLQISQYFFKLLLDLCPNILVAVIIRYLLTKNSRRPPNTLPLVGNGILFLQARHKLFSWFVKCERLFGFETFQIYVPSLPPGVVINDPKNLEYVFKNEGIFAKGDFFKRRSWDLFGGKALTRLILPPTDIVRKWNHQCRR